MTDCGVLRTSVGGAEPSQWAEQPQRLVDFVWKHDKVTSPGKKSEITGKKKPDTNNISYIRLLII